MLHARGHQGLTLTHTALLANLDREGTRITTLAQRVGMTKQSMGQLAHDLETRGYIARMPDPDDRRAARVIFTVAGQQFLRDAHAVVHEIETEYADMLGAERLALLQSALEELLAHETERRE